MATKQPNRKAQRKERVEELLADFRSLRRAMVFRMPDIAKMPRITPSQWGVLRLVEQQQCSVKDVSKALGISSSAATQLIDGLVKSSYLTKETSAKDRRSVFLNLSPKSKVQVDRMKKHALDAFLKLFEALNDEEFEQYVALNKKLTRISLSKRTL